MIHKSIGDTLVCKSDWIIVKRHTRVYRSVPEMSHFGNFGHVLPVFNNNGFAIYYIKWDATDSHKSGSRYVIGSDGRVWLTTDHYKTF